MNSVIILISVFSLQISLLPPIFSLFFPETFPVAGKTCKTNHLFCTFALSKREAEGGWHKI